MHHRCDAHLYPNQLIPQLINYLKHAGVSFKTNNAVQRIIKEGNKLKKVITAAGKLEADVVVMAGAPGCRN